MRCDQNSRRRYYFVKKHFVVILALAILSALVFIGCEKKQTVPPPTSQPVVTQTPAPAPAPAPKPALKPMPTKPAKK